MTDINYFKAMYRSDMRHIDEERKYSQVPEVNSGEMMTEPNYLANSTDAIIRGKYYKKMFAQNQEYLARNSETFQVGKFIIPREVKYDRRNVDNLCAETMKTWGLQGSRADSRKLQQIPISVGKNDFEFNIYNRRPNVDNAINELKYKTYGTVNYMMEQPESFGVTESRKMLGI